MSNQRTSVGKSVPKTDKTQTQATSLEQPKIQAQEPTTPQTTEPKPQPQTPVKAPKTVAELWAMLDARLTAIEARLAQPITTGRGPISTRPMTEDDARRIMVGDLKDTTIKACATTMGLSYGQVYSARNGYTFKSQYKARKDEEAAMAKK